MRRPLSSLRKGECSLHIPFSRVIPISIFSHSFTSPDVEVADPYYCVLHKGLSVVPVVMFSFPWMETAIQSAIISLGVTSQPGALRSAALLLTELVSYAK